MAEGKNNKKYNVCIIIIYLLIANRITSRFTVVYIRSSVLKLLLSCYRRCRGSTLYVEVYIIIHNIRAIELFTHCIII